MKEYDYEEVPHRDSVTKLSRRHRQGSYAAASYTKREKKNRVMPQRDRNTYIGAVTERRSRCVLRYYSTGETGQGRDDVRARKVRAKRADEKRAV